MTNDERNAMSPLEIAVWATKYVNSNNSVEIADAVIVALRGSLAHFQKESELEVLRDRHVVRVRKDGRDGSLTVIGCSCGYMPRNDIGADTEELMTLHLAFVGVDRAKRDVQPLCCAYIVDSYTSMQCGNPLPCAMHK